MGCAVRRDAPRLSDGELRRCGSRGALVVFASWHLLVTHSAYNQAVREGLSSVLYEMEPVQLALLFVAAGAYLIAINASLPSGARAGAASAAFTSSIGFAALSPSLMSGVVFLALAVLSAAVFVGAAWLLSELLGLSHERGAVSTQPVPDRSDTRADERRWADVLGRRYPALVRAVRGRPR